LYSALYSSDVNQANIYNVT